MSNRFRAVRSGCGAILALLCLWPVAASGQEQVDKPNETARGGVSLANLTVRARVTAVTPEQKALSIVWRHGGEGLGGEVFRGEFASPDGGAGLALGAWSAPLPLAKVAGGSGGWKFPTIVVSAPPEKRGQKPAPLKGLAVEIEFADKAKPFKTFTETAANGATVGFAVPTGETDRAAFEAGLQGLSGHARGRRQRLETFVQTLPGPATAPRRFGVIGHLGGYGEGAGYGIRHSNPDIVKDECETLRMLGVNGFVGEDSVRRADAAGFGQTFRRVYWGGPGSGSPMGFFRRGGQEVEGCPFDPALKPNMAARVKEAVGEYKRVGAKESWALWWDEIGVAAKAHINHCPQCAEAFRAYLRSQKLEPKTFGKASWDEVTPYPIWADAPVPVGGKPATQPAAAPPIPPGDGLRYYYTFRFLTVATAQLFPESAKALKDAGVPLYAMQGPTPSWGGHSLDWHEFYDLGANNAVVWETSNRDPRVWQWESYLADIVRGIADRHALPVGCLIKPHRGAPEQRMLSVVSRGASVIEWYTYGPDYAKGDSFSQSPELLEKVAKAARFLGRTEDLLHGARRAGEAQVAFVSPRSSEIWGKATDLGVTAFEDAKWVYLALAHAHVPVDVLSEQQLAEGKLERYKVIYMVGPNLRRDAAASLRKWVEAGGMLWTDALGLSRDEANQPLGAFADVLGRAEARTYQRWGGVEAYRAVGLQPLVGKQAPGESEFVCHRGVWGRGKAKAAVGREPLDDAGGVVAHFADGKAAVVRRSVGRGDVVIAGFWAGLTYSAKVRRDAFDMRADFDPAVAALIAAPAIERKAYRPVVPSEAQVEAVLLVKDGRRCIALMNWGYRAGLGRKGPAELLACENLRIALREVGDVKSVQSVASGELKIEGKGAERSVVLPRMQEIDLLILD